MNILVLTPTYYPFISIGGPIFTCLNLYDTLKNNNNIEIITTLYGNNFNLPLLNNSKNFSIFYCKTIFRRQISLNFLYLMCTKIKNFNSIHMHGVFSFFVLPALILNLIYRKNIYLYVHGAVMAKNINFYRIDKLLIFILIRILGNNLLTVIYNSEYEYVSTHSIFNIKKYKIIPHTLPEKKIQQRNNFNYKLLFIGRIEKNKRVDLLINAVKKINSLGHRNLTLDIIGDGSQINKLMDLCKFDNNIKFWGVQTGIEKDRLLVNCDFLVLPSLYENFGNVVIEALSVGTPALVTDESPWGILDFVNAGATFDGSLYDLIYQIELLYKKDYSTLRANSRNLFLKRFSNNQICSYYE